jgi:rubrerythrin
MPEALIRRAKDMAVAFNADEVYEMGEQIERNGKRFYQRAAKQTDNADVRSLLRRLAEMEADHEKLFHNRRVEIAGSVPQVEYDPDDEVPRYLHALVKGEIFGSIEDLSGKLTGKESTAELLRMAVAAEKDSVVFYVGIKDLVSKDLGGDKIDWLIRQELDHVADLVKQLNSLSG